MPEDTFIGNLEQCFVPKRGNIAVPLLIIALILGLGISTTSLILNNPYSFNDGYNLGYDDGYAIGLIEGNQTGYDLGWLEGNESGYISGFLDGYNAGSLLFYLKIASLNITIAENFNITITNDSGNIYDNTTWDIRRFSTTLFTFDIDMIRAIYEYIEENEEETININDANDIYTKLGIQLVEGGITIENFADAWTLLDNWVENNRSIIGDELVCCYRHAFIPTFKIYAYANNTLFNGTNYTGADNDPSFGFWFNTTIGFLFTGGIFDDDVINELDLFQTYNENELTLTELILDVDGLSYEIKGKLNGINVEWNYITFF